MSKDVEAYERLLAREISGRKEAETLLDQKSLELYQQAKEHERTVEALRESEGRYRLLVELSPDAILIERSGAIVFVNAAALSLFGAHQQADLIGRSMLDLVGPDGKDNVLVAIRNLERGELCPIAEEQALRLDGKIVEVAVTRSSFTYGGQPAVRMIARDISERKELEKQLLYQAHYDPLTGLANRNLLRDRLSQAIVHASRYDYPIWVVFLDLDRFKSINDNFGHTAGDALLNATAKRLQSAVRKSDTVARLGGDEFVVLLAERKDESPAIGIVQRIMDTVVQPLQIERFELRLTCSIGVAVYPLDGDNPEILLTHADIAMYRAKETGRNNFQFYKSAMNERARQKLLLEEQLRNALERNELLLHYQPQLDLRTGRIVGMEALIRWQHPKLGMVPPINFIGIAEETGLILPIGAWVLRTACAQAKAWQQAGLAPVRISVNLSARQFAQRDLVQSIASALNEIGLDPRWLDIELTESLVMTDVAHAVDILQDLKKLGVNLSIDDFGTGYSSLSYLKRFPIDVLKIDQSFVNDMTVDRDDAAIVLSIITLAHSLRLRVIAEGVETAAQLAYLRRHGCDEMQGHYFSRPLPADALENILRQGKHLRFESELGAEDATKV